jgi:hypothetical protein
MLAKLSQVECAQGFVRLMYSFVEMLGKVMEFMLPSGSAVWGNSQQLLPIRTQSPLIQRRASRRSRISGDLSRTGRTRHLNPARHPFPWSPYSE